MGIIEKTNYINILKRNEIFKGLKASVFNEISEKWLVLDFPADYRVVNQGSIGDFFFIVAAGEADVIYEEEEKKILISRLNKGDFFGEMALIKDIIRQATVISNTPLKIIALKNSDFIELLERNPEIRCKIEVLSGKRKLELLSKTQK